jgi:hypothetical protein
LAPASRRVGDGESEATEQVVVIRRDRNRGVWVACAHETGR